MRNLNYGFLGIVFAVVFLSAWLSAAPADAATTSSLLGPGGEVCPGDNSQGVTVRVVECVRSALLNATLYYVDNLYGFLRDTIYTAITLAIIIYGVWSMARGALDLKATWGLVIKIAVVVYFVDNTDEFLLAFVDGTQDILDSIALTVMQGVPTQCPNNLTASPAWGLVDCVIGKLFGAAPGVAIKAGMLGFVVKLLFSQSFGAFLFIMGLAILLTLIFAVARCVQIFLNAMTAICIIVMLSPLIVPMILFGPTKKMFDGSVKMILGFLIQTIFLPLYLLFMMITMQTVMFEGPNSLFYVIAGPSSQNTNFVMMDYIRSNDILVKELKFNWLMDLNPRAPEEGEEPVEDTGYTGALGYLPKIGQKSLDFIASHIKIGLDFEVIDFQRLADARGVSAGEMLKSLALTFMSAMLIMYVMEGILKYIPDLAFEIGDGAYESVNLSLTSHVPGHQGAAQMLNNLERKMAS